MGKGLCPREKQYLLERPELQPLGDSGSEPGYTRNVDIAIHVTYWERLHQSVEYNNDDSMFREQQELIELVRGCELAIFNDPTTNYPYRDSFCGITGTMTNIMTGGFFHLYLHVLKVPGILVNVCTDLVTIFEHLNNYASYEFLSREFIIPKRDNAAIREIINILMQRKMSIPHLVDLFSEAWFKKLGELYLNIHIYAISRGSDSFYYKQPNLYNLRRSRGFKEGYIALFPEECNLEWRDLDIIGDYPNRPSYLVRNHFEVHTGISPTNLSSTASRYLLDLQHVFLPSSRRSNSGGSSKKQKRKTRRRNAKVK